MTVQQNETSSSMCFNLDGIIAAAYPLTTIGKGQYKIMHGINPVSLPSVSI